MPSPPLVTTSRAHMLVAGTSQGQVDVFLFTDNGTSASGAFAPAAFTPLGRLLCPTGPILSLALHLVGARLTAPCEVDDDVDALLLLGGSTGGALTVWDLRTLLPEETRRSTPPTPPGFCDATTKEARPRGTATANTAPAASDTASGDAGAHTSCSDATRGQPRPIIDHPGGAPKPRVHAPPIVDTLDMCCHVEMHAMGLNALCVLPDVSVSEPPPDRLDDARPASQPHEPLRAHHKQSDLTELLVATGGDDQAVGVLVLRVGVGERPSSARGSMASADGCGMFTAGSSRFTEAATTASFGGRHAHQGARVEEAARSLRRGVHSAGVRGVAYSRDRRLVLSVGADSRLHAWQVTRPVLSGTTMALFGPPPP